MISMQQLTLSNAQMKMETSMMISGVDLKPSLNYNSTSHRLMICRAILSIHQRVVQSLDACLTVDPVRQERHVATQMALEILECALRGGLLEQRMSVTPCVKERHAISRAEDFKVLGLMLRLAADLLRLAGLGNGVIQETCSCAHVVLDGQST
jgi:hypothetical protein